MNEKEFDRLLDASSLGAPHVDAARKSGLIPDDVRARLEEGIRQAERREAVFYAHHKGWPLRVSLPGPVPDPTKVHLFSGLITPCYAYQGQPNRLATPLVFHPSTTRPTCVTCRYWEWAPKEYEGPELLHRGAARMVNQAFDGGDKAQVTAALRLLAAPLALEPLAAFLAQTDVPRET